MFPISKGFTLIFLQQEQIFQNKLQKLRTRKYLYLEHKNPYGVFTSLAHIVNITKQSCDLHRKTRKVKIRLAYLSIPWLKLKVSPKLPKYLPSLLPYVPAYS